MREAVRSGRRANFYITENGFIDHYARQVGLGGIAVYHVLERYMNCETRSTWIGTAKMAELLGLSQRAVQRYLRKLEELKLIRIVRTATMTVFFVVPVPPRPKAATIPLFDAMQESDIVDLAGDTTVAFATPQSSQATTRSRPATLQSPQGDTSVAAYKEEQDLLNKTQEQDGEPENPLWRSAVESAYSDEQNLPPPSQRKLALRVVGIVGLPATPGNIGMVEAAIVAEAAYMGQSLELAAEHITQAAIAARDKGVVINKFYFEDVKWRQEGSANARARGNKAEQRKLHNLEINARVKQRFREGLGDS